MTFSKEVSAVLAKWMVRDHDGVSECFHLVNRDIQIMLNALYAKSEECERLKRDVEELQRCVVLVAETGAKVAGIGVGSGKGF